VTLLAALGTQWVLASFVTGGGLDNRIGVLINVVVVSGVGALVYLGCARLLRIDEIGQVVGLLRRRVRRASADPDA
jgi:hypothetical protein